NQINPKKIDIDNKKSPKEERIKEELKKLNLDKKSIDKIILNYSLGDIEEKLGLLKIKRNVVNPAGWLIAALKANYLNPKSSKEENDGEEKTMETEEVESESKIVKPNKLALKKKEKEHSWAKTDGIYPVSQEVVLDSSIRISFFNWCFSFHSFYLPLNSFLITGFELQVARLYQRIAYSV
ncbi:unnamed protein product, partial [marine sediment metagenome]